MYEELSFDKQSVFANFEGLALIRVTFGWEWLGRGKSDSVAVILFSLPVPPEEQKK